ncbi:MAG TPA: PhoH family protein, partial [Thiothrix sp.]|nr:PhoH family protein [Thiothrix sp.]
MITLLNTLATDDQHTICFELDDTDSQRLINLCGQFDQHLRLLEQRLGVQINNRGHQFNVSGTAIAVQKVANVIQALYQETAEQLLTPEKVHLFLQENALLHSAQAAASSVIRTKKGVIKARGVTQQQYINDIRRYDLNFGIGPAGTGKTYLAVACAVEALEKDQVRRIILVRPAVEAGEKLGFLPGDLAQKVDPYLRPMYDALYDMLGFEKVAKLMERNVIEVAPLAYMRGRTLNDAFIILDEAQNTSPEQMKMFLTRLGFGSTAVITGDVTQIDLPRHQRSGLNDALQRLNKVKGISFTHFMPEDVVRHQLVQRIVEAYAATDNIIKQA